MKGICLILQFLNIFVQLFRKRLNPFSEKEKQERQYIEERKKIEEEIRLRDTVSFFEVGLLGASPCSPN